MIIFKSVKWKNFLSTGNTFTTIDLDRQPTTLIVGDNGAGKSTILDALCFVLFNKPFRIIKKSQLVNSVNNTETVVEVNFEIGTRKYRVMRGIKPNKFEIYCNDKMVNQDANSRDYQKYLEQNVLRLKIYCDSFLLNTCQNKTISTIIENARIKVLLFLYLIFLYYQTL